MSTLANWIERRVQRFADRQRRNNGAVRVLAEGDSWFTQGGWMWSRSSLIQQLNRYRTVNIVSLAQPGAELSDMIEPANRRQWSFATNPDWLSGENYDVVLISGGGNDVVGESIRELVRNKTRNASKNGRELVIASRLKRTFSEMRDQISSIRATVDSRIGMGTPILMHGYDYAFPSGENFELLGGLVSVGPWIKNNLMARGVFDIEEQQDIVNFLIDEFNDFLGRQSNSISNFKHIDLRGVLSREHWADELHPTAQGRKIIAARLREEIVEARR